VAQHDHNLFLLDDSATVSTSIVPDSERNASVFSVHNSSIDPELHRCISIRFSTRDGKYDSWQTKTLFANEVFLPQDFKGFVEVYRAAHKADRPPVEFRSPQLGGSASPSLNTDSTSPLASPTSSPPPQSPPRPPSSLPASPTNAVAFHGQFPSKPDKGKSPEYYG